MKQRGSVMVKDDLGVIAENLDFEDRLPRSHTS